MNRCCKIRFYDCIKEYFQYNGDISEDIYQVLENKKDTKNSEDAEKAPICS